MRNLIATLLAILMVLGSIPLAVTMFDDPDATGPADTSGTADQEAGSGANAQAGQDEAAAGAPSEDGTDRAPGVVPSPALLRSSPRGATPLEMTENLLGPAPSELRAVDPTLSLQDAIRMHPSFSDDTPKTPGLEAGPVAHALARIVQAHGILTEVQTAASNGDPVGQKLMPYAAAQLATEAKHAAPVFDTASTVLDIQTRSDVQVSGDGTPVQVTASLQEEIDRLYANIGLPSVPASAYAGHDPTQLARLVHATADVVETTREAQQMGEVASGIDEDLRRVDEALSDGVLTPQEAKLVAEVATLVHEVTTAPLQARLNALDTLYATVDAVVPSLAMPADHDPLHSVTDPVDEAVNETQRNAENATSDAEGTVEDAQRELENATQEAENETEAARDQVEETIQPVEEELADNFVDPFGAIVILGEDDDAVNGSGTPVPVNVPGVGPVGSLFPRSPLLVVDRGGDDVYTGIPRTRALQDTITPSDDPLVGDEDLPVQGDEVIEGIQVPGILAPFEEFIKAVPTLAYTATVGTVEQQLTFELAVQADTPAQVVVDLSGNDRYEGEIGAAYAAGGGTAAIFDREGSDVYEVDKGIGLLQEDGLALVKDFAGDDRYTARRGIGSVIQPYTIENQEARFDETYQLGLGGLGGLVDVDGDDVYEVEEAGIGVAFEAPAFAGGTRGNLLGLLIGDNFQESTHKYTSRAIPLALDLAGGSHGFQPTLNALDVVPDAPFPTEPEPNVVVEKDDGGSATAWTTSASRTESTGFFGTGTIQQESDTIEYYGVRLLAANRTYDVDLSGPTDQRIQAADHNVTVQNAPLPFAGLNLICTGGDCGTVPTDFTLQPHNEILLDLDGQADQYEPPYPLILIDAGNGTDTYRNATPASVLLNQTSIRPSTPFFDVSGEDDATVAPMLVLDSDGDDRYEGETAHLNTSRIARYFTDDTGDDENPTSLRYPAAGSVLVDVQGDDTYHGNVSSIDLNLTLSGSSWVSLVHDGSGSDRIDGELIGGIRAEHALTNGSLAGQDSLVGHSLSSLLLMGSEEDTERNTITAGEGSLGSVAVERHENVGEDARAHIPPTTKMIAASAITAPTDYRSTNHSLGSVRWCQAQEPCPKLSHPEQGLEISTVDHAIIAGLFVGSNGPDTYTLDAPEGLGTITIDDEDVCELEDNQLGAQSDIPSMVTRFIDAGGGDDYRVLHPRADLPPWQNDDTWRPFDCPNLEAPAVENTAPDQAGGADRPDQDSTLQNGTLGSIASTREFDTLGIDNLGQYVLDAVSTGAGETVQDAGLPLIAFESPQLCVGPYAQEEPGSPLLGLEHEDHRCADPDEKSALDNFRDELSSSDRIILTTKTDETVPANAFSSINPCDTGGSGDRSLSIRVHDEYAPEGNPLAHNTSGCWATLQIKPTPGEITSGPVWEAFDPTGTGWLDLAAGPVHCGFTDENTPVRCTTDAFPLPYHVDGTNGRNQARWFLSEGSYEYRMKFHGPLGVLLGVNSTLSGHLTIDRQPLLEASPVEGAEHTPTRTLPGILTWLDEHNDTVGSELPGALSGFQVRALSQDDDGEPTKAEVWAPITLADNQLANEGSNTRIVPMVCFDGTPYRGRTDAAESLWRGDLGLWVTRYPLTSWSGNDDRYGPPPAGCSDVDSENALSGTGTHDVKTSLWVARSDAEPQRVTLPDTVTSDTITVDDVEPFVDIGPLQDDLGVDLESHGLGLDDIVRAEVDRQAGVDLGDGQQVTREDLDRREGGSLELELPIHVLDESAIEALTFAGQTDAVWEENWIGEDTPPIKLLFDLDGTEHEITCTPPSEQTEPTCSARLNLTSAGQGPGTGWHRNATVNLDLPIPDPDEAADGSPAMLLYQALVEAIEDDDPIDVQLPSGFQVSDEAGNTVTSGLNDLVLDLRAPTDLALPCDGDGANLVTTEDTADIMTFIGDEDGQIEGLYMQRRVNGSWMPADWVPRDEMVQVDRFCEPDSDGQWRRFAYTASDAADGKETTHLLRTITVDHAGNHEISTAPFEFSVLFDKLAPTLTATQTAASPHQATVLVTTDEPVVMDQETHLVTPAGQSIAPISIPDEQATEHTLQFHGLDVNTTYTLNASATDEAGLETTIHTPVATTETLRVSLRERPEVAGDNVTVKWAAGALGPKDGGSPSTRVSARPLQDGQPCSRGRSLTTFVDAPLSSPENHTLTVPLTECPAGNLTIDLTFSNGPEDEPVETISLNLTLVHDVTPPVPSLSIEGDQAPTGWYTSPVSLEPTGEDDVGIRTARILTPQGPVKQQSIGTSGDHEVIVQATDEAGRTETEAVRVPVDLARPHAQLVSQDELPTERSVITVQVQGSDDASGLRSIRTLQADGTFGPWGPVVEDMQMRVDIRGLDVILAEVRDRAGHVTQTVLPVTSLADPPEVTDSTVEASGPGTVSVHAVLDRALPLEATALQDGHVVDETITNVSREHRFTLEGLTPATPVEIQVRAQLSDGRSVTLDPLTKTVQLPADAGPPTVPTDVTADVLEDGTVRLTWAPAQDDAGIESYLVQRSSDGAVTDQWSLSRTRLLDVPAGASEHTYRVKAVDLSGRTGAWSAPVTVTTELPSKILSYNVTPEVAPAGSPVSISVLAQGSQAPDTAYLELGDKSVPLVLEEGGQGRWLYRADVTLPTTDTFFPEGVRVHLGNQTFPAQGTFPGPVVKALDEGEVSTTSPVPGPGIAIVIAAGVLAAIRRRRWSQ